MKCNWCQNEFEPRRKNNVFCKKYCRDRASEKKTGWRRLRDWKRQGINLSLEEFDRIANLQKHRCLICNRAENEIGKTLVVDHCHTSGKIRGLLCASCNISLGAFGDDPKVLEAAGWSRAASYVISHL